MKEHSIRECSLGKRLLGEGFVGVSTADRIH